MQTEFDYIVIGGGAAGCAAAARIAEGDRSAKVALIEAGPRREPTLSRVPAGMIALVPRRSAYNYAFETLPQPGLNGRRGFQPRGRGLGGSSLINAMVYVRGQAEDYNEWAKNGCPGWAWSDVLPYFKRSENNERGFDAWHAIGGPQYVSDLRDRNPAVDTFVKAACEAGHAFNPDFNGAGQAGVGPFQVFQRNGRRFSAARAYLSDPTKVPNLSIVTDAQVQRVIFEGNDAVAVSAQMGSRRVRIAARREIVISAGTYGSPQLLMLSGVGPAEHLQNLGIDVIADVPDVGANLQDHLQYVINVRSNANGLGGLDLGTIIRAIAGVGRFLVNGRGLLASNMAEAGAFLKSSAEQERPDIQIHFCVGPIEDHGRKPIFGRGMSFHITGLRPKSRGRVRLRTDSISVAPSIDPQYLLDSEDLDVLVAGVKAVDSILATPTMSPLVIRTLSGRTARDTQALIDDIRERADSIYHPVGTCRMGGDPRSVVDSQLQVRNVRRLRVADASIMPTLVSGNTQAPATMIGEKAADLILGRTIHLSSS